MPARPTNSISIMLNNDALAQLKQVKADIRQQEKRYQGVVGASQGTYGFVRADDGQQYFLPPPEMQKTFPGDRIEFQVRSDDKDREYAAVEKLLSSELKAFCGKCVQHGSAWFVQMDLPRLTRKLFLPPNQRKGIEPGDWLACRVSRHPVKQGKGQASVTRNLGKDGVADFPSRYSLVNFQLRHEDKKAPSLPPIEAQFAGREDCCELAFASIDPPSSRDVDDALYARPAAEGWEILVAIADPASVIDLNDPAARSALERGATAYLPHLQVPMLHPSLSEDLLSLRAGEQRLALLCKLQVASNGETSEAQFVPAVIRNRVQLAYSELNRGLEQGSYPEQTDTATRDSLGHLAAATAAMGHWRAQHQLVPTERPEFESELDEQGRIVAFKQLEKGPAQRIVEECMLAVNQQAANKLAPFGGIFSKHDGFRSEKLGNAASVLRAAGFEQFKKPGELNRLEVYRQAIRYLCADPRHIHARNLLSRFLQRAGLSSKPAPHLGMGVPHYLGFTSPLRRYADFFNHHQMRRLLAGEQAMPIDEGFLEQLEQRLEKVRSATYWADHWLRCEYLQRHGNGDLTGQVVQANPYGVVVRLAANGIEGIVEKRSLPEGARFDPADLRFTRDEHSIGLDDQVVVTVKAVLRDQRKILFDWQPVAAQSRPTAPASGKETEEAS